MSQPEEPSRMPRQALSPAVEHSLDEQRVLAAVFCTYQFDPGFFELEILPVLLDATLSHATAIRRIQVADALISLAAPLAVYYDAHALLADGENSAALDYQRVPVRWPRTGRTMRGVVFHPKNLFILTEPARPPKDGESVRGLALHVWALSANLTRSGWWRNVEAVHHESIGETAPTLLRDDILGFFRLLRQRTPAENAHPALDRIEAFLRRAPSRSHRSAGGRLYPRFHDGEAPFADFLESAAGDWLRDARSGSALELEIISPYLGAPESEENRALDALVTRFRISTVRLMLPRNRRGQVSVPERLYDAFSSRRDINFTWGRAPEALVRPPGQNMERFVHAKVYRFFTRRPRRELCFIGSVNLTDAAHKGPGGNCESGLLVEVERPLGDFWLVHETRRPACFETEGSDETEAVGGTALILRYDWAESRAEAYWDAPTPPPASLTLETCGTPLGEIKLRCGREWIPQPGDFAKALSEALLNTSFVDVLPTRLGESRSRLLVQETGMAQKPSLREALSAAEILRYWAMLSPEGRAEFLEQRLVALLGAKLEEGAEWVARIAPTEAGESFFDRLAGFFLAFSRLEAEVDKHLTKEPAETEAARYRLFGRKHDSLGTLIERVSAPGEQREGVDRYVLLLCARQTLTRYRKTHPDFWAKYAREAEALHIEARAAAASAKESLITKNTADQDMARFLDWMEPRFLKRAKRSKP